ncbi:hypothetical protein BDZ85DRAFT_265961 [Elsinoe ampelina]|uniref:Uncharacterized protein n=1 Tax=Elsinoe ampelina TaxID=302913 RepID=A0A6A6G5K6_9PEZI|nr:hypothetical protein BDZ85DRAFT_265961 [Elsinoe ampelina]
MSTAKLFRPWQDSPSLSTSMEDFESNAFSPNPSLTPSTIRLGPHRSPIASTYSDVTDDGLENSWSPPAWRKAGSGWFRQQTGLASPMRSRAGTPDRERPEEQEDEEDIHAAAEIPLPGSPVKGRSVSRSLSPQRIFAHTPELLSGKPPEQSGGRDPSPAKSDRSANNYIRFSMRADVQHRTQPIEDAVVLVHKTYSRVTRSKYSAFLSFIIGLVALTTARILFQSPVQGPAPDLVKVAGLAKSFEPLMFYSENGHSQVVQLGETGVAVWDLGESVRSTNMTSGPIIVKELDNLSDSLKSLALELTRFFANIDGDIDSILIVMEWAQRELSKISSLPESKMSTLFSNLHTVFSKVGVLENPWTGGQTAVGKMVQDLFGPTAPQLTRNTLQRTFMDFLGVLEESINNELTASISLFAHFEAIDRQFLNLQRVVIRETDAQEREESEVLASLWSRIMGANAARLKKFEKNKSLLSSLRERTVQNKHVLVDHNGRLLQLRSNLEILRKKLVSPLVRSNESSTLSVEEQLQGLEGTYLSLRATRQAQKARIYEIIHEGAMGSRRTTITRGEEAHGIEDR